MGYIAKWRRDYEKFPGKRRPRLEIARNPSVQIGIVMPAEDHARFRLAARMWARDVGRPETNCFSEYIRFALGYTEAHTIAERKHARRRVQL